MPVKLNCTAKTNVQSKYKLVWMKGDAFVTGNGYSIESTQFDNNTNTENHYLMIHRASPGTYTCMLISTRRMPKHNMSLLKVSNLQIVQIIIIIIIQQAIQWYL